MCGAIPSNGQPITPRSRAGWRRGGAFLALSLAVGVSPTLAADEVLVPAATQVELLSRIIGYETVLPTRIGGKWRILILKRANDPESDKIAFQVAAALREMKQIQGLPHEGRIEEFRDPAALAELCATLQISILYLAPGFTEQMPAIATAIAGRPILTVAATPGLVARGAILGFDLVSGRKQIVVGLSRLRANGLEFGSGLLRLARVVR